MQHIKNVRLPDQVLTIRMNPNYYLISFIIIILDFLAVKMYFFALHFSVFDLFLHNKHPVLLQEAKSALRRGILE